ncbi:hypothetical protein J6590_049359 [Homalodisca vitripennis]|nr:hypothetical protein J6590_049359 [Homalodisca vitripennis]
MSPDAERCTAQAAMSGGTYSVSGRRSSKCSVPPAAISVARQYQARESNPRLQGKLPRPE